MSSLNVMTFTGRLGADAELKFTQGGTPIWTARVAVDYGWGDKKGTTWLNAKALGKHAESLGKLELAKGAQVGGTGELQVREYDRNDGSKGTAVEVLVNSIALLGPKVEGQRGGTSGSRGGAPSRERPQRATEPAQDFADDFSDSIPFATNRSAW